MPMFEGLQNKIGPLPVWAWGGLGAAGLFFILSRNKGSSTPSPSSGGPQVASADAGAAMGFAQMANIWQLQSDQNQQLQSLLNKQQSGFDSLQNSIGAWGQNLSQTQVAEYFSLLASMGHCTPDNPFCPGYKSTGSGAGDEAKKSPVFATSQLTPATNGAATPSPLGRWFNGAPDPYASMYGYSVN